MAGTQQPGQPAAIWAHRDALAELSPEPEEQRRAPSRSDGVLVYRGYLQTTKVKIATIASRTAQAMRSRFGIGYGTRIPLTVGSMPRASPAR